LGRREDERREKTGLIGRWKAEKNASEAAPGFFSCFYTTANYLGADDGAGPGEEVNTATSSV
jgi:hypothetical protein